LEVRRLLSGEESRNDSGWVDAEGRLHLTLSATRATVESPGQFKTLTTAIDRVVDEAIQAAPRSLTELSALVDAGRLVKHAQDAEAAIHQTAALAQQFKQSPDLLQAARTWLLELAPKPATSSDGPVAPELFRDTPGATPDLVARAVGEARRSGWSRFIHGEQWAGPTFQLRLVDAMAFLDLQAPIGRYTPLPNGAIVPTAQARSMVRRVLGEYLADALQSEVSPVTLAQAKTLISRMERFLGQPAVRQLHDSIEAHASAIIMRQVVQADPLTAETALGRAIDAAGGRQPVITVELGGRTWELRIEQAQQLREGARQHSFEQAVLGDSTGRAALDLERAVVIAQASQSTADVSVKIGGREYTTSVKHAEQLVERLHDTQTRVTGRQAEAVVNRATQAHRESADAADIRIQRNVQALADAKVEVTGAATIELTMPDGTRQQITVDAAEMPRLQTLASQNYARQPHFQEALEVLRTAVKETEVRGGSWVEGIRRGLHRLGTDSKYALELMLRASPNVWSPELGEAIRKPSRLTFDEAHAAFSPVLDAAPTGRTGWRIGERWAAFREGWSLFWAAFNAAEKIQASQRLASREVRHDAGGAVTSVGEGIARSIGIGILAAQGRLSMADPVERQVAQQIAVQTGRQQARQLAQQQRGAASEELRDAAAMVRGSAPAARGLLQTARALAEASREMQARLAPAIKQVDNLVTQAEQAERQADNASVRSAVRDEARARSTRLLEQADREVANLVFAELARDGHVRLHADQTQTQMTMALQLLRAIHQGTNLTALLQTGAGKTLVFLVLAVVRATPMVSGRAHVRPVLLVESLDAVLKVLKENAQMGGLLERWGLTIVNGDAALEAGRERETRMLGEKAYRTFRGPDGRPQIGLVEALSEAGHLVVFSYGARNFATIHGRNNAPLREALRRTNLIQLDEADKFLLDPTSYILGGNANGQYADAAYVRNVLAPLYRELRALTEAPNTGTRPQLEIWEDARRGEWDAAEAAGAAETRAIGFYARHAGTIERGEVFLNDAAIRLIQLRLGTHGLVLRRPGEAPVTRDRGVEVSLYEIRGVLKALRAQSGTDFSADAEHGVHPVDGAPTPDRVFEDLPFATALTLRVMEEMRTGLDLLTGKAVRWELHEGDLSLDRIRVNQTIQRTILREIFTANPEMRLIAASATYQTASRLMAAYLGLRLGDLTHASTFDPSHFVVREGRLSDVPGLVDDVAAGRTGNRNGVLLVFDPADWTMEAFVANVLASYVAARRASPTQRGGGVLVHLPDTMRDEFREVLARQLTGRGESLSQSEAAELRKLEGPALVRYLRSHNYLELDAGLGPQGEADITTIAKALGEGKIVFTNARGIVGVSYRAATTPDGTPNLRADIHARVDELHGELMAQLRGRTQQGSRTGLSVPVFYLDRHVLQHDLSRLREKSSATYEAFLANLEPVRSDQSQRPGDETVAALAHEYRGRPELFDASERLPDLVKLWARYMAAAQETHSIRHTITEVLFGDLKGIIQEAWADAPDGAVGVVLHRVNLKLQRGFDRVASLTWSRQDVSGPEWLRGVVSSARAERERVLTDAIRELRGLPGAERLVQEFTVLRDEAAGFHYDVVARQAESFEPGTTMTADGRLPLSFATARTFGELVQVSHWLARFMLPGRMDAGAAQTGRQAAATYARTLGASGAPATAGAARAAARSLLGQQPATVVAAVITQLNQVLGVPPGVLDHQELSAEQQMAASTFLMLLDDDERLATWTAFLTTGVDWSDGRGPAGLAASPDVATRAVTASAIVRWAQEHGLIEVDSHRPGLTRLDRMARAHAVMVRRTSPLVLAQAAFDRALQTAQPGIAIIAKAAAQHPDDAALQGFVEAASWSAILIEAQTEVAAHTQWIAEATQEGEIERLEREQEYWTRRVQDAQGALTANPALAQALDVRQVLAMAGGDVDAAVQLLQVTAPTASAVELRRALAAPAILQQAFGFSAAEQDVVLGAPLTLLALREWARDPMPMLARLQDHAVVPALRAAAGEVHRRLAEGQSITWDDLWRIGIATGLADLPLADGTEVYAPERGARIIATLLQPALDDALWDTMARVQQHDTLAPAFRSGLRPVNDVAELAAVATILLAVEARAPQGSAQQIEHLLEEATKIPGFHLLDPVDRTLTNAGAVLLVRLAPGLVAVTHGIQGKGAVGWLTTLFWKVLAGVRAAAHIDPRLARTISIVELCEQVSPMDGHSPLGFLRVVALHAPADTAIGGLAHHLHNEFAFAMAWDDAQARALLKVIRDGHPDQRKELGEALAKALLGFFLYVAGDPAELNLNALEQEAIALANTMMGRLADRDSRQAPAEILTALLDEYLAQRAFEPSEMSAVWRAGLAGQPRAELAREGGRLLAARLSELPVVQRQAFQLLPGSSLLRTFVGPDGQVDLERFRQALAHPVRFLRSLEWIDADQTAMAALLLDPNMVWQEQFRHAGSAIMAEQAGVAAADPITALPLLAEAAMRDLEGFDAWEALASSVHDVRTHHLAAVVSRPELSQAVRLAQQAWTRRRQSAEQRPMVVTAESWQAMRDLEFLTHLADLADAQHPVARQPAALDAAWRLVDHLQPDLPSLRLARESYAAATRSNGHHALREMDAALTRDRAVVAALADVIAAAEVQLDGGSTTDVTAAIQTALATRLTGETPETAHFVEAVAGRYAEYRAALQTGVLPAAVVASDPAQRQAFTARRVLPELAATLRQSLEPLHGQVARAQAQTMAAARRLGLDGGALERFVQVMMRTAGQQALDHAVAPSERTALANLITVVQQAAAPEHQAALAAWHAQLTDANQPLAYSALIQERHGSSSLNDVLQDALKPLGVLVQIQEDGEFVAAPVAVWITDRTVDGQSLQTAVLMDDFGTYRRSTSMAGRRVAWVYLPGSESLVLNTRRMIQDRAWLSRQREQFRHALLGLFARQDMRAPDSIEALVDRMVGAVAEMSEAGEQGMQDGLLDHRAGVLKEERTHFLQEVNEQIMRGRGQRGAFLRIRRDGAAPLAHLLAQLMLTDEERQSMSEGPAMEEALQRAHDRHGNLIPELEAILARWAEVDATHLASRDLLAHLRVIAETVAAEPHLYGPAFALALWLVAAQLGNGDPAQGLARFNELMAGPNAEQQLTQVAQRAFAANFRTPEAWEQLASEWVSEGRAEARSPLAMDPHWNSDGLHGLPEAVRMTIEQIARDVPTAVRQGLVTRSGGRGFVYKLPVPITVDGITIKAIKLVGAGYWDQDDQAHRPSAEAYVSGGTPFEPEVTDDGLVTTKPLAMHLGAVPAYEARAEDEKTTLFRQHGLGLVSFGYFQYADPALTFAGEPSAVTILGLPEVGDQRVDDYLAKKWAAVAPKDRAAVITHDLRRYGAMVGAVHRRDMIHGSAHGGNLAVVGQEWFWVDTGTAKTEAEMKNPHELWFRQATDLHIAFRRAVDLAGKYLQGPATIAAVWDGYLADRNQGRPAGAQVWMTPDKLDMGLVRWVAAANTSNTAETGQIFGEATRIPFGNIQNPMVEALKRLSPRPLPNAAPSVPTTPPTGRAHSDWIAFVPPHGDARIVDDVAAAAGQAPGIRVERITAFDPADYSPVTMAERLLQMGYRSSPPRQLVVALGVVSRQQYPQLEAELQQLTQQYTGHVSFRWTYDDQIGDGQVVSYAAQLRDGASRPIPVAAVPAVVSPAIP
ncbi:MAG: hypothetical protein HY600_04105, partial [Candidatus Omnitrophica bacterium]|nr:hypothetical protein [Candidatus Omnitrophota bacterium]